MKIPKTILILLFFPLIIFSQNQEKIQLANEYFQQGEINKAKVLYDELASNPADIQLISSNYLSLLKSEKSYRDAEKLVQQAIKYFPSNLQFKANLAGLYYLQEAFKKYNDYLRHLQKTFAKSPLQLSVLAQHLANEHLYDSAIDFFRSSRAAKNDPGAHALEMASLYRIQNNKSEMVEEYLNYASLSLNRLSYVKNLLQSILQEEEDLNELEASLIQKMQLNPDDDMFAELLIWVELQRKNFYGAFLQARAIDKRNAKPGDRSMEIGKIALDNKAYDEAIKIFEYVSTEYSGSGHYSIAKKFWIESREQKIKNTFPIDNIEIRNLVKEYHKLYKVFAPAHTALEALRSKALLHAFYLEEIDSARHYLSQLVSQPGVGRFLLSQAKLDLGDMYLLRGEPWEATLLYSQVEKVNKSHPLGYDAKLRNARLNYFTGNFSLAKSHLDILKKNTTREISNDALSLGMLITDNTALDTTDQVMQQFSTVELLIFQNKKDEARDKLVSMLQLYEHHPITDEIYWVLAGLELEFGNSSLAVDYLDRILASYGYDILADDAAFKKAEIFDYQQKNVEEAQMLYKQFLIDYPGSMYVAVARKRFRQLRGDFVN